MKIISWNINGINASIRKGLLDYIKKEKADVYCFQETKSSQDRVDKSINELESYNQFWNSAEKKGYSGILTLSRIKPLSVKTGLGKKKLDTEGRTLLIEFEDFFLINVYFPNAGHDLKRLDFKMEYNKRFQEYTQTLREKKPIIICGDFNVAHEEIDLANPTQNRNNTGFTDEERNWFDKFLKMGYVDTFREFVKEGSHYTYWTYLYDAREKNIGWRIDYFIVSNELRDRITKSEILNEIMGSDHCPIRLIMS